MPIYEYKCKTCGKNFEYYQKMSDEPLKNCLPEICDSIEHKGKGEVYRVFSKGVGLIFKGNGFYITDYSRKNSSIAEGDKESNPKNGTKEVSTAKETI